jgi:hypothetical protein
MDGDEEQQQQEEEEEEEDSQPLLNSPSPAKHVNLQQHTMYYSKDRSHHLLQISLSLSLSLDNIMYWRLVSE